MLQMYIRIDKNAVILARSKIY